MSLLVLFLRFARSRRQRVSVLVPWSPWLRGDERRSALVLVTRKRAYQHSPAGFSFPWEREKERSVLDSVADLLNLIVCRFRNSGLINSNCGYGKRQGALGLHVPFRLSSDSAF